MQMHLSSSSAPSAVGTGQLVLDLFGGEIHTCQIETKKTTRPKARYGHLNLTLPLFGINGEVAVLFDNETSDTDSEAGMTAAALSYMDNMASTADPVEEVINWTDEEVSRLHSVLLEQSIKALAAKGNANQKKEILDWIFAPDIYGIDENKFVYADQIPFSFQLCCKLEGIEPDVIRDFIDERIRTS